MPLSRSVRLLTLLLSAPLVACTYGHLHDDDDYYHYPDDGDVVVCSDTIQQATIDSDELLDVDAGIGAGAFIEYQSGGTYYITTACDVDNGDCLWDILVRPLGGAPLIAAGPADLEQDDSLVFGANDELQLVAYTGSDFDGFTVQTEPGAGLSVDALLDNTCGNRYLFWVGDGALRSGAPSNPIDLIPSAP